MSYEGDNWVMCDQCDFKVRASEAKEMWNHMIVCKKDFECRHPQEYMIRGRYDNQMVEDARPRPDDVFGTGSADDL